MDQIRSLVRRASHTAAACNNDTPQFNHTDTYIAKYTSIIRFTPILPSDRSPTPLKNTPRPTQDPSKMVYTLGVEC